MSETRTFFRLTVEGRPPLVMESETLDQAKNDFFRIKRFYTNFEFCPKTIEKITETRERLDLPDGGASKPTYQDLEAEIARLKMPLSAFIP